MRDIIIMSKHIMTLKFGLLYIF